ncbi:CAX interacting protein 1 [Wolffia australiana]
MSAAVPPSAGAGLRLRPAAGGRPRVVGLPRRVSWGGARGGGAVRCCAAAGGGALTAELRAAIDKVVGSSKVVVFMKGNRDFPQCGFSNTVVQILKQSQVPFETVDVLESALLRHALKEYSAWPTFPQLYIDGAFFGGCDITVEAFKSGELQELLERTMCS